MTENEGGTPRDPQRETPPTQPVPEPGAVPPASATPQEPPPAGPPPAGPADQRASAPYGPPEANPPYGQPGAPAAAQYGYAPTPPKNDLGVWALVTGILSFVFCPLLLGIAAIITGTMSRKAADEGLANNRGMGTAGLILGWVNVALVVVGVVLFVILLAAGLMSGDWNDMNYPNEFYE
jgi:hypothetical protein